MTLEEESALWVDHMTRGGDLCIDRELMHWVLARYARAVGRHFFHLEIEP